MRTFPPNASLRELTGKAGIYGGPSGCHVVKRTKVPEICATLHRRANAADLSIAIQNALRELTEKSALPERVNCAASSHTPTRKQAGGGRSYRHTNRATLTVTQSPAGQSQWSEKNKAAGDLPAARLMPDETRRIVRQRRKPLSRRLRVQGTPSPDRCAAKPSGGSDLPPAICVQAASVRFRSWLRT